MSAKSSMPAKSSPTSTQFVCANCQAQYEVVRMEADSLTADRAISCRHCGAPLTGRDGDFVLKYFLVSRRRSAGAEHRLSA